MKKSLILLPIVAAIAVTVLYFGLRYLYTPPLPEAIGLKQVSYTWQHQGVKYSVSENLYESIYDYYGERRKGIYRGMEDRSIENYLKLTEKDGEVQKLVARIKNEAEKKKFDEDQTLELAVSFIQAIPYDDVRARTDLILPRYPYEVLYDKKGICSDKTILALAVLRQMGYGTATFMYDEEQHMAAAVSCPREHSNYNTGYCIVETTAVGSKIGVIPEIEKDNLRAVSRSAISTYDSSSSSSDTTKLSKVEVFTRTSGKVYQGIIKTVNLEKEIAELQAELDADREKIAANEKKLEELKTQLERYYAQKNYTQYNATVVTYNNLVSTIKREIAAYNAKVTHYNTLIKQ